MSECRVQRVRLPLSGISVAPHTAPMAEDGSRGHPDQVLLKAEGIYQWQGPKMRRTIFNVRRGTLMLTDRRLVYVAEGGTDVWLQIARESTGLLPGPAGNLQDFHEAGRMVLNWIRRRAEGPLDEAFYPAPLETYKDGTFLVPVEELVRYSVVEYREWGFKASYLSVAFEDGLGQRFEFALSDKRHIPGRGLWQEAIDELRRSRGVGV